jgi:hypothetical protein
LIFNPTSLFKRSWTQNQKVQSSSYEADGF